MAPTEAAANEQPSQPSVARSDPSQASTASPRSNTRSNGRKLHRLSPRKGRVASCDSSITHGSDNSRNHNLSFSCTDSIGGIESSFARSGSVQSVAHSKAVKSKGRRQRKGKVSSKGHERNQAASLATTPSASQKAYKSVESKSLRSSIASCRSSALSSRINFGGSSISGSGADKNAVRKPSHSGRRRSISASSGQSISHSGSMGRSSKSSSRSSAQCSGKSGSGTASSHSPTSSSSSSSFSILSEATTLPEAPELCESLHSPRLLSASDSSSVLSSAALHASAMTSRASRLRQLPTWQSLESPENFAIGNTTKPRLLSASAVSGSSISASRLELPQIQAAAYAPLSPPPGMTPLLAPAAPRMVAAPQKAAAEGTRSLIKGRVSVPVEQPQLTTRQAWQALSAATVSNLKPPPWSQGPSATRLPAGTEPADMLSDTSSVRSDKSLQGAASLQDSRSAGCPNGNSSDIGAGAFKCALVDRPVNY